MMDKEDGRLGPTALQFGLLDALMDVRKVILRRTYPFKFNQSVASSLIFRTAAPFSFSRAIFRRTSQYQGETR
jgi:hypothetical protein